MHQLISDVTAQLRATFSNEIMLLEFALDIEQCVSYAKSNNATTGNGIDANAPREQMTSLYYPAAYEARLIQVSNVRYRKRYAPFRRPGILGINGAEKVSFLDY